MEPFENPLLTESDYQLIDAAEAVRRMSIDPHRKVGCVIAKDGVKIAEGHNHFPFQVAGDSIRLNDQRIKNLSILHAELAAIADAAERGVSVNGCSAFITCHPCSLCANVLIRVGIRRVVCPNFINYTGKWLDSFKTASDDMYNSGILVLYNGRTNG
jgi:dCMP deaminase